MFRTIIIPLLAIVGISFAAYTVVTGSVPPPPAAPVVEPPTPPFENFVAGAGLIEAADRNIEIGAPVGAIVKTLHVQVGQDVQEGEALFTLDARDLEAQMTSLNAALAVAQQQLTRLEAGTRAELLPPQRARVAEGQASVEAALASLAAAQASTDDARDQVQRAEALAGGGGLSAEEVTRRRFALRSAEARLDAARASVATARAQLAQQQTQLELLEAGSWSRDLDVSKSQVAQAQAAIDALKIELDRRVVRAPKAGRVLQVNVRAGEFAPAGATSEPLLVMGQVSPLHVRVDVDEFEAWRVQGNRPAVAFARGNKNIETKLRFVRFEPYVIPKRSLTGSSTERVDTRVLQVIYAFDPKDLPLYVGQQVDVYIEADAAQRVPAPTPSS